MSAHEGTVAVMANEEIATVMANEETAADMASEETSGPAIAGKVKKPMKVKAKAKSSSIKSGNPPYVKMVTEAITELKERKGSSRQAILNYVCTKYKVDAAVGKPRLNRTLKKMIEKGEIVAGAKPGSSGAGCFKLSPETKKALRKEAMAGKTEAKMSVKGNVAKKSVKGKKLVATKGKMKEAMAARIKGVKKDARGKKSKAGKTVAKMSAKGNVMNKSLKGKKLVATKGKKKAATKTAKGKKGDMKNIIGGKTAVAKPKKKVAKKGTKSKK